MSASLDYYDYHNSKKFIGFKEYSNKEQQKSDLEKVDKYINRCIQSNYKPTLIEVKKWCRENLYNPKKAGVVEDIAVSLSIMYD